MSGIKDSRDYYRRLNNDDLIPEIDGEICYTPDQMIWFAEKYHAFKLMQANGFPDNHKQALPIRDVNGCWVVSNDERPTEYGIYTTIDSHGIEGETLFDNKHWIIKPDRHPVQLWLKPNWH